MKSVLLYSKQFPRMNLQKLSACLYYDQKNDCFYRLNVMPQCTLFVGEDVERREMMALTRFDPTFHMIQLLFKMKDVMADELADCLKKQNWKYIATEQVITAGMRYSFNKQKIFDFLEKKVEHFEKYLEEKNPLQRLKVLRGNEKYISADTVTLLKNEISPELVNQFVSQRFPDQHSRKISPQQEPQALKPKPMQKGNKKAPSKQPTVGKDQPTLFGSWGKKK